MKLIKAVKHITVVKLITSSILLFVCLNIYAADKTSFHKLQSKVTNILREQLDEEPGIALLIRKDDQVIFESSKGSATKNTKIQLNTGFRIGSISKPFTALAIMQLLERGQILLTDSVTQYVTELPKKWETITLHHLLSHRVSVSRDFFADQNLHLANNATNADVIKFLISDTLKVSTFSGKKGRYCNVCYVLLAETVERVSGKRFAEYMQQNIFIPSKMTDSYIIDNPSSLRSDIALNYAKTSRFFGIQQYNTGAMGQVSSLADLSRFIVALKGGKIVASKTLKDMTKVHADLGDDGFYGLGWIIGWGKQPFFSHGGSNDGYQSELFFHPKLNLEIVFLSNGGEKTYELQSQLMRTVISYFKSEEKL
ncbi:serine hydrolase domain-containing protein [Aliikangiella coralliicola]|uniref:Beta-lactamase family protein n=1 Tax=Aliikangiella coralliicola TaxID=2592383 RepID=A0A545UFS2_9GAMM|nr:serine hydrolase domain-containing protein [Aliikangiella coralliicola]TQV88326.1 beta-lactamase family protein [Aliikangiella coralliicola]